MKNKLLMEYTLPEKLLLLLGIKNSEITGYMIGRIYFERYDRKLAAYIDNNISKTSGESICVELYDTDTDTINNILLFRVNNITCDEHFKKFRKMLEIELIDCKDGANKD